MKLRKRKLFSSMAFVLSLVMLAVSGAVFVHTATQQSASTSLSVTFNGMNVNFSAQAWYQVDNDSPAAGHKKELVTTSGASGGISFSATAPSGSQVLKVADAENPIQLNANDTFVLFTYKFTNTASSNAKGMLVSLSNSGVANNSNLSVKYYTSTTDYTATGLSTQHETVVASQQTEFSNVFISAQSTKYFYILVSLIDNTLGATYDKSSSPLNWTITCSEETEPGYTVTFSQTNVSGYCTQNASNSIDANEFTLMSSDANIQIPEPLDVSGIPARGSITVNLYYQYKDGNSPTSPPGNNDSTLSSPWTQATGSIVVPAGKTLFICFAWTIASGYLPFIDISISGGGDSFSMGVGYNDYAVISRLEQYYASIVVNSDINFSVSMSAHSGSLNQ